MKKWLLTLVLTPVLFLLTNSGVEAARFFLVPAATAVYQGSGISVYLQVDSSDQPSNSYTAVVSFDGNYLTPLSVSKSGSICTLFVAEPSISASSATVTCGLPSPGYNGASGNLITMNFRATKLGTTHLGISGGAILANDGYGTNILRQSTSTSIRIIAAEQAPAVEEVDISKPNVSADKGEPGEWLKTDTIKFSWDMPEKAEGFSYILTQDNNENPEKTNATSDLSKTYSNLKDGVYYFKIYATDGDNYSDLVTYEFKIDNTGPEEFNVVLEPKQEGLYETLPLLGFAAVDSGSGVDRYEIRIDNGEFVEATNPYVFSQLTGGTHTVVLRAYDMVGNFSEKEISFGIIEYDAPVIISPVPDEVILSTNGLVISGTGEPHSSILLYLDGELIGVAQTNGEGRFTFSYNDTLLPGPHELTARVKNEGGILGTESQPISFLVEEALVAVGSLDFFKENVIYIGLCGGLLMFAAIFLLIFLLLKRRKKNEEEEETDGKIVEPAAAIVATDDPQKEREIERRLNEARREIDDEFRDLERELREKVEDTPGRDPEMEHQLERGISEAIEESEDKIENLLNPEKIIDNKQDAKTATSSDDSEPDKAKTEQQENFMSEPTLEANSQAEVEQTTIPQPTPTNIKQETPETPAEIDMQEHISVATEEDSPNSEKINNEIIAPESGTPTYTLGEEGIGTEKSDDDEETPNDDKKPPINL